MLTRKFTLDSGRVFLVTAPRLSDAVRQLRASDDGKFFQTKKIEGRIVKIEIDDGHREIVLVEGRYK